MMSATTFDEPESPKYWALVDLYRTAGALTPAGVVAAAEPESSPLHDAFEWDDAAAAVAHRMNQARDLIQRYEVKVITHDDEVVRVRAFVHEAATRSYAPVREVVSDAERRSAAVARIRAEYVALASKAKQFAEFAELVAVTDQVVTAA